MIKLAERIMDDNITMEYTECAPPSWAHWGAQWYDVTLTRNGRKLRTPFGCGEAASISAAGVLECLLSDTAGVLQARDYHEWLTDLGMSESDAPRSLYARVQAQARKLRRWLGADCDAYLYETEL